MKQVNRTAQIILILLIILWIVGLLFVRSVISYLAGSVMMYLMTTVVLNKMKMEIQELKNLIETRR